MMAVSIIPVSATAQRESVQERGNGNKRSLSYALTSARGPLLPARGTRLRELNLKEYYYHDYNTLFRSVIVGLSKRIISTPREVKAPESYGDYWEDFFNFADLGKGWDTFVSKLVAAYSMFDTGAFIEVIGPGMALEPGDPTYEYYRARAGLMQGETVPASLTPIIGRVTGVSVLDTLRCRLTGDSEYPVIYYDIDNKFHLMHYTRVIQFVDSEAADDSMPGYGDCALARAIGPVNRQILMDRYIETLLDDNPPPGIMTVQNLTETQFEGAVTKMQQRQQTDIKGEWGRTVQLFGLQPEITPKVEFVSFSKAPENFDREKYTTLDAREIAAAVGVDIQDFWELSGGGIGTGTQSEILHQKSKGKAFGSLLKRLERTFNLILPTDCEFEWKYVDPEEDRERAEIAQLWATTQQIAADVMTPESRLLMMVNQIEAVKDAVTDEKGDIVRWPVDDPKTPEQVSNAPLAASLPIPEPTVDPAQGAPGSDVMIGDARAHKHDHAHSVWDIDLATYNLKAFGAQSEAFKADFKKIVDFAREGVVSQAGVRSALRRTLLQRGAPSYRDGLRDAGADLEGYTSAQIERAVTDWLASQNTYINRFVDEVYSHGLTDAQVGTRAELWANKSLREIYYRGMAAGAGQARFKWTLGATEEHCRTCLMLNGQVHQIRAFITRGLIPGSRNLVCGGWYCDCRMERTDDRAHGNIRAVRFVR